MHIFAKEVFLVPLKQIMFIVRVLRLHFIWEAFENLQING